MTGDPHDAEPDWHFGCRTPIEDAIAEIAAASRDGRGFAMIRLGDGEGVALHDPQPGTPAVDEILNIWFGEARPGIAGLDRISTDLRHAIGAADLLGLPSRTQFGANPQHKLVFEALRGWPLPGPGQRLVDANFHWYLQFSGAFETLLRGQPSIGVIGCRDAEAALMETFGIGSVRTWRVRGESGFAGPVEEPHWPDGYERVLRDLTVERPGEIVLVGAGVLGKLYCARVKAIGGVAIDVGSLLDAWTDVPSRARYPRHPELYAIDRAARLGAATPRAALDAACETAGITQACY